ncbi:MAG: methylenetetrahydrofolate reductase [Pseudomonadota bacterium]
MAKILAFGRPRPDHSASAETGAPLAHLLEGFSLEVMPRTAAKIPSFAEILPAETRIYIAHIDGTPFEEMLATARRLRAEGFTVMPHIPARVVETKARLMEWAAAYADLGIDEALLLAGGVSHVRGELSNSMQMLESGILDRAGFRRLHVAGHPEGNRDIDPTGGEAAVMEAVRWKQAFAERTGAEMALVTQFVFEAQPVIDWAARLREAGVTLPIHVGVAGPAKLQTLIKFALACGVGPSLRVLQRRAADITKLMLPFTPEDVLRDLAAAKAADPALQVERVHFFPLGGITGTAGFTDAHGRLAGGAAAATA